MLCGKSKYANMCVCGHKNRDPQTIGRLVRVASYLLCPQQCINILTTNRYNFAMACHTYDEQVSNYGLALRGCDNLEAQ